MSAKGAALSSSAIVPLSGFVTEWQAFEAKLVAFYEAEKAKLIAVGEQILPIVEAGAEKVLETAEVAIEDLAGIAGQAVLSEATNAISGREKFGNAVANTIQTVEGSGKTVATSVAQAAVQTAFDTAQNILAKIRGG